MPGGEVDEVLLGHRRQLLGAAGDVEALARRDDPAELDVAVELAVAGAHVGHAQAHRPVGEVDRLAGLERRRRARASSRSSAPRSRPACPSTSVVKVTAVAAAQHRLVAVERADAHLRAREILEDRDRPPGAARRLAHQARGLGVLVVGAVAEVQPRDVHAGLDQPGEDLGVPRGGADRRDDLRAAFHGHVVTVPSRAAMPLLSSCPAWAIASSRGSVHAWPTGAP